MAARTFKMYPPVSKAGKPKHKNWDRRTRFMEGHDAGCIGLLPESILVEGMQPKRRPKQKIGVYRAHSFGYTREQRIVEDALKLLNYGYVQDLEEALDRAIKNNPEPEYSFDG